MSENAIEVKGLTKEFRIPHRKVDTVFEQLVSALTGNRQTYERFLALKDISFTVEKGESIGIIGGNGSGKSTLLKLIARILTPTSGSVRVEGSVMPFIELGVGFQYDLSARENVYLYGSFLSLKNEVIERRYKELVEFAELENFMDMKLKDFSSGMVARLAFSTAIMADPDILLIDEVLAVGDIEFRKKCIEKMNEYKRSGKTILLVSHDLSMVKEMCPQSILLDGGKASEKRDTEEILTSYFCALVQKKETELSEANAKKNEDELGEKNAKPAEKMPAPSEAKAEPAEKITPQVIVEPGPEGLKITDVRMSGKKGGMGQVFETGESVTIILQYTASMDLKNPRFGTEIRSSDGTLCAGTSTRAYGLKKDIRKGEGEVIYRIDKLMLLPGCYTLSVSVYDSLRNLPFDSLNNITTFQVSESKVKDRGIVLLEGNWSFKEI